MGIKEMDRLEFFQLMCIIFGVGIIGFVIGVTHQQGQCLDSCVAVVQQLDCLIPLV